MPIIILAFSFMVNAQSAATVTIINSTEVDICGIAVSASGTDEWVGNILDTILGPGEELTLPEIPLASYDLIVHDCANQVLDVSFDTEIASSNYTWDIVGFDTELEMLPAPPLTSSDQTWLVMLYIDADDEPLEQSLVITLNETELIGSSDQVHIVAQMDRFAGGFDGDGDWTTTKRFYVTQDSDLGTINSEEIMDIGEVNMSDGNTLVDFVRWAATNYEADKYVLILHDHGSGWPGGWTDHSEPGDMLTLSELDEALATIQDETGISQFELVGFDACLMSSLEVYTTLAPYARYAVASEEVTRSIGWAYFAFLNELTQNPGMSGSDLGESIVRNYIAGDILVSSVPQDTLAMIYRELTISAVDLAAIPNLLAALDEMSVAASEIDQSIVAQARFYSQSYTSIFGNNVPPSYLDVGHLAAMLATEGENRSLYEAATQVSAALNQAIIAERHGPALPGSTGMTIYFPNSILYAIPDLPGSRGYTSTAERFSSQSLWDDFLLTHYTGAPMPELGDGHIAFASEGATIIGPGAGTIQIVSVQASSDVFSMSNPVLLSTEITGGNVALARFFAALFIEETNSLQITINTLVEANENKDVNGVLYPNWDAQTTDGVLSIGGNFWPEVLVITDGTTAVRALFLPEGYGGAYAAYGTHISAATGESRRTRMRFDIDSAALLDVYVFNQEGNIFVPREISLEPGDQFIAEVTLQDLETGELTVSDGDILTFRGGDLWLDTAPATPGVYLIGIQVFDLDGNRYSEAIWLTVEADE